MAVAAAGFNLALGYVEDCIGSNGCVGHASGGACVGRADKHYYTLVTGLYNSTNFETASLGQPRMYGMRLRYSF